MDGASERVIGDHLAKRPGPRDRLVIATKFALTMDPDDPNNGGTGRKALRRHVEESLTRLRTDHLDLYWQHRMFVGRHLGERTWTLLDTLGRVAAAHGTTVAAASLAWVRQQPMVTSTVIGARTVAQPTANLASLEVVLTGDELAELDVLTAPDLNFPAAFLRDFGVPAQQGEHDDQRGRGGRLSGWARLVSTRGWRGEFNPGLDHRSTGFP
jgi:aryl-alcohol dehydrogenase-like predicted oxidoreductase